MTTSISMYISTSLISINIEMNLDFIEFNRRGRTKTSFSLSVLNINLFDVLYIEANLKNGLRCDET